MTCVERHGHDCHGLRIAYTMAFLVNLQDTKKSHVQCHSPQVRCTVALSECRKVSAWELATKLLKHLDLAKVQADAVTCGAAVSCFGKAAQWQRALQFFSQAREGQVQYLGAFQFTPLKFNNSPPKKGRVQFKMHFPSIIF